MNNITQVGEFGTKLMTSTNIDDALILVSNEVKSLVNADRCSIFIVDAKDQILWTKLSDGIGRIVVSLDSGIVGDTYKKQEIQIVNNPYEDPRFLQSIDKKSGYTTKNMICVPMFNSKREVMGIIQLLNKSRNDFDEADSNRLAFFANFVSGSLELLLMNES